MISIQEAFNAVLHHTGKITSATEIPLQDCLDRVLAQDVLAPIHMPPFRQSAMDGYALRIHNELDYKVVGEIRAGDDFHPELGEGEAVRIFTGAPVPDTADAVVMQEQVKALGERIEIEKHPIPQQNIRPEGEQVTQGALALAKGTPMTPAAMGYLSSLGLEKVTVYKRPSVAILTTGDELIAPGTPLSFGKIYESNSVMLSAAFREVGIDSVAVHKVDDDYEHTYNIIKKLIEDCDMVVITGGISVGDYDFVGKALKALEVEEVFYKVKQKPGKPLYFGKKKNTVLFALPGNPAAALSCFYLYIYPAVQRMAGYDPQWRNVRAVSETHFTKSGDRPQFLKAVYREGRVTILEGQSSAMLQTFALANALIMVPEDLQEVRVNDTVEVILLPVKETGYGI